MTFLGLDLFTVEINQDEPVSDEPGDSTSYPVGFTNTYGDQAWEQGVER